MKDFEDLGVHCGVDEAGRGAWSGPVVAAAVRFEKRHKIVGLADSKALSPQMRIKLYFEILETFSVGVYFSSAKVIDKVNILNSSLLANFTKLIKLIKTSFEDIEKLNDNPDQEIDIKVKEENIENALRGLEYLSKNKYYSKNERDLFLEIIKQFNKDEKEYEEDETNTNYFYYYLGEIKTMLLSTYFNVKFYIEGLFN